MVKILLVYMKAISSEWLKQEMTKECIFDLQETGFKVRVVISDDHSENANAFSHLLRIWIEDKNH